MSRLHHLATACLRKAAWVAPALWLAACGGGGGDGIAPAPASSFAVTSANQHAVAADALDTASNVSVAVLGLEMLAIGASPSIGVTPGTGAVALLLGSLPMAAPLATGVQASVPLTCVSGTGTVSGNVAVPGRLAAGDSIAITADHCVNVIDGVNVTLNGTLGVTVVEGSADSQTVVYPLHIAMDVKAQNFSATTPSEGVTSSGEQRVDVTEDSPTSGRMVVSGAAMSGTVATSAGSHTSTFRNFVQSLTHSGTLVTLAASGDVETDNRALGSAAYRLDTPASLAIDSGAFSAGTLRIVANQSALQVRVTGVDVLALDLDDDGDGETEGSTSTTTGELRGLV